MATSRQENGVGAGAVGNGAAATNGSYVGNSARRPVVVWDPAEMRISDRFAAAGRWRFALQGGDGRLTLFLAPEVGRWEWVYDETLDDGGIRISWSDLPEEARVLATAAFADAPVT